MGKLRIGSIYRYARPYKHTPQEIDGLPNYFQSVYTEGQKLPLLERGINPMAAAAAPDGSRVPAILISSSPHKIGSEQTPWQDTFDADNGFIRYFGDTKQPDLDPATSPGNAALRAQFFHQSSPDPEVRRQSVPIIYFRRVPHAGRQKGNVMFQGFGIVTRAELITQYHPQGEHYFSNYVFEFAVFSLAKENEIFDWQWIAARRDHSLALDKTVANAPQAWRQWITEGPTSIERCRRNVAKLQLTKSADQRPEAGSKEEAALNTVYSFYDNRKARFENLASRVTASILQRQGTRYREGWITPASSDHGADFIGRVDLGTGFSLTKLVMLGQAKCENPWTPTGGNHIARTVARLKRGWVGAYVTTSYFSEPVQQEVIEDQYPILLIHGLEIAREVLLLTLEGGFPTVQAFLTDLDQRYEQMLRHRRPEEILLD
jgi:hypothetical protein